MHVSSDLIQSYPDSFQPDDLMLDGIGISPDKEGNGNILETIESKNNLLTIYIVTNSSRYILGCEDKEKQSPSQPVQDVDIVMQDEEHTIVGWDVDMDCDRQENQGAKVQRILI
jgi:hypothetical protein